MKLLLVFVLFLFSGQVSAQAQFSLQSPVKGEKAPVQLLGVWGTAEQCIAHRHGEVDNPSLFPYRISAEWVGQGGIYCYLSWQDSEHAGDELRVNALARCGEDNLREYRLSLSLQREKLRIRWSDDFTTRALEAC